MVSLIFGVTTSVAIFPKRNENRVNLKTISVESASVTTEMTALKQHSQHCYPTITWKTYLTQMSLACSTSVYHLKRTTYLEKVFWRQEQIDRLTDMAAASATGEKLKMFVIGNTKKPRCFRNVKQLPCRYRAQKKSWITGVLFEELVRNSTHLFEIKAERLPF